MKLLGVNFDTLIGEAVGIAVLNGVPPKEIAAELRRMADITEQSADELQKTIASVAQGRPPVQAPKAQTPTEEEDVG